MNAISIEDQLALKRQALDSLIRHAREHYSATEYAKLQAEVLDLERLVAKQRGVAYAEEWSLPDIWKGMVMGCIVVGNQSTCSVIFEVGLKSANFAVLCFKRIAGYKLTDVGDEIIAAHQLTGRGLKPYGAFLVENSPWLQELEMIDRSHPQFDQQRWRVTKHYLLCFKDRMFEALALEAKLAGKTNSKADAIEIAIKTLG